MLYAKKIAQGIETRRKAFIRKWRLKHRAVADSLEEAGDRLAQVPLTLNVLLSFARFERELIGERVRDKIAASKRKGGGSNQRF
jgi:hypothetical protein